MSKLNILVKYSGTSVDDGSMDISDVVVALQGFSNAYSKIVSYKKLESQYLLRIKGIKKGSCELQLFVQQAIIEHPNQIQITGLIASSAIGIVGLILKIIELTKHTENKSHTIKVAGSNNLVVVNNSKNVQMEFPKEAYEIYKEGLLKQDLSKIVSPIEQGKIDSANIIAEQDKEKLAGEITFHDKPLFEYSSQETTKTEEMILTGQLISLNKERKGGSFYLQDGTRIAYRLISDHPETMYQHFLHKGLVRVKCVAHLDENIRPIQIDISTIEDLQLQLFDNLEE